MSFLKLKHVFITLFLIALFFGIYLNKTKEKIENFKYIMDESWINASKPNDSTDIFIGNNKSNYIIQYGSFSCHKCGQFFLENFNKLQQEYIKTNKIKFVYRNITHEIHDETMSNIIKCKKIPSEITFELIKNYYINYGKIKNNQNEIKSLAIKTGFFNKKEIDKCLEDHKLNQLIENISQFATKNLDIKNIPTLIFNNIIIEDSISYEKLKNIIEKNIRK